MLIEEHYLRCLCSLMKTFTRPAFQTPLPSLDIVIVSASQSSRSPKKALLATDKERLPAGTRLPFGHSLKEQISPYDSLRWRQKRSLNHHSWSSRPAAWPKEPKNNTVPCSKNSTFLCIAEHNLLRRENHIHLPSLPGSQEAPSSSLRRSYEHSVAVRTKPNVLSYRDLSASRTFQS